MLSLLALLHLKMLFVHAQWPKCQKNLDVIRWAALYISQVTGWMTAWCRFLLLPHDPPWQSIYWAPPGQDPRVSFPNITQWLCSNLWFYSLWEPHLFCASNKVTKGGHTWNMPFHTGWTLCCVYGDALSQRLILGVRARYSCSGSPTPTASAWSSLPTWSPPLKPWHTWQSSWRNKTRMTRWERARRRRCRDTQAECRLIAFSVPPLPDDRRLAVHRPCGGPSFPLVVCHHHHPGHLGHLLRCQFQLHTWQPLSMKDKTDAPLQLQKFLWNSYQIILSTNI